MINVLTVKSDAGTQQQEKRKVSGMSALLTTGNRKVYVGLFVNLIQTRVPKEEGHQLKLPPPDWSVGVSV